MPSTPTSKYAIQRPADSDDIRGWPASMRASLDALDALIVGFSIVDPRPAAGKAGRLHRHPTTGVISFDDGTAWHEVAQMPHASRHAENGDDPVIGQAPIGAVLSYAGSVLPPGGAYAWADGSLIDRTVYATFFSRVGHAYNGGVDPGANKVRLPDKRGRVMMGADNFGSGAAGRITVDPAARGGSGGAERVPLAIGDLPAHDHGGGSHVHNALQNLAGVAGGGIQINFVGTVTGGAVSTLGTNYIQYSANIGSQGSGATHQNLPPHENDLVIVRIA